MEKPKFNVGDKVRVIGNTKILHGHEVGSVGIVVPYGGFYRRVEGEKVDVEADGLKQTLIAEDLELIEQAQESDNVNHPSHYGQGKIEAIDYIEDMLTTEEYIGYLRGNIAKYLHRWRYKNGLEDLKKAEWYLNRLISEAEKQ